MITDIDDYFTKGCGRCDRFATPDCSTRRWIAGLDALRQICLSTGMSEVVKWGHPCYMHSGRNIALIGAFRGDFRISFMNASLLRDDAAVLEKSGPNASHPDTIRFTDDDRVGALAAVLRAYLTEAIGYAEAGIRPEKIQREIELPDELIDAMDCDPELAEAFHRLTPGRRRSYVINLNGARKPETRVTRIGKFRDRILAGKGALER